MDRLARVEAYYTAEHGPKSGLNNHIEDFLKGSSDYKAWMRRMPTRKPSAIATYQTKYDKRDDAAVSQDVLAYGDTLDVGQTLFHGGYWTGGRGSITTSRPLSTSFSPTVAFQNALWKAKAYDAGRLDLMVLKTTAATTKAYVFGSRGKLSHELEGLLAAGAKLTFVKEACLRTNFNATKYGHVDKKIPVYVVELDVS